MSSMQPPTNYDSRNYIGKILLVAGIICACAATVVAWPGLRHVLLNIFT
jgi:hypothetical protein